MRLLQFLFRKKLIKFFHTKHARKAIIIVKILWKIIFFIGITTSFAAEIIPMIPQPKEYKLLNGNCFITLNRIITNHCVIDKPIQNVLEEIKFGQPSLSGKSLHIIIVIPTKPELSRVCQVENILPDESIGTEGYFLKVLNDSIFISANTTKGIFYGLQSLKQLLNAGKDENSIQCVWIKDYPAFKWRGVMDDISRGPVPTVEFVKQQIKRLAELKINMFMHYTEHVIKTNSHPSFAPVDGNFTVKDYKALTEYAKGYNVSFVGNFQSFGHFSNILKTPAYSSLGESGTLISPVKNESYSFLKDIYSEMTNAFASTFFHVNCDETFDLGKETSKLIVDSLGYDKVYFQHIMKLRDLFPKNTRMMLWGDVLLQYPKLLADLPKDVAICTWNYDSLKTFSEFITPFIKSKHDLFVSPGIVNSNRIFPDYKSVRKNIDQFCKEGASQNALGVLMTVWDDGGLALFGNDWYGVSYSADKSWNTVSTEFDERFDQVIYGCNNCSISGLIKDVSKISSQVPTYSMNDKVFWERINSREDSSYNINVDGWIEVEQITADIKRELNNITVSKNLTDMNSIRYVVNLYNTLANERLGLVQFSKLYKEAIRLRMFNEKRGTLLSLQSEIKRLVEKFKELRKEFEKVWFSENQPYTFSKIDSVYSYKISSLQNISNRIEGVFQTQNASNELPKPIDVGLEVNVHDGKYFLEWLSINPFQYKNIEDVFQTNYLAEQGEENKVYPSVTQELLFNNKKHRWKRIVSSEPDKLDLNQAFPDSPQKSVTYLYANIDVDSAFAIDAKLNTSSLVAVFLNGETIVGKMDSVKNTISFNLFLRKGKNNLMLKVIRESADWNISLNVRDIKIVNQKNRYKVL